MKAFGITGRLLTVNLPPPDPAVSGSKVKPKNTEEQNSGNSIVARARALVEAHPPAISGQDGSGTLFKLCLALAKGLSLGVGNSLDLILALYNPRCQPPWTEDEIRHKLADANASTEVPDGFLLGGNGKVKKSGKDPGHREAWWIHSAVPNAPLNLKIPGSWEFSDGGMALFEGEGGA